MNKEVKLMSISVFGNSRSYLLNHIQLMAITPAEIGKMQISSVTIENSNIFWIRILVFLQELFSNDVRKCFHFSICENQWSFRLSVSQSRFNTSCCHRIFVSDNNFHPLHECVFIKFHQPINYKINPMWHLWIRMQSIPLKWQSISYISFI